MEYFIIALIAVMWGWREFVKSMRLNTIEQELEGIWTVSYTHLTLPTIYSV